MSLTFDADAHEYRWKEKRVPGLTHVLRSVLGDPFARVPPAVLERARQRGQAVHRACELDDAGQLDPATVDPEIAGYLEAWRTFRRLSRFRVVASERPIYHRGAGYACTPDVIFETPIGWGVIEIKSGAHGIYAQLQTAAQLEAARDHYQPVHGGGRRFVMRLGADGKPHLEEHRGPSDWRDFLSCLNVQRLKERIAAAEK